MKKTPRPFVGKETLRQVCEKLGIPVPDWRDEKYELIDMDWFQRIVAPSVFHRVARDVGPYEEGSSDCDDFGSCAWEEVKRLYRLKPDRIKGCAAAFGTTDIWESKESSHDLCILFYWANPENEIASINVAFFEPQQARFANVTREQWQSAAINV